jgi:hypothetical protein
MPRASPIIDPLARLATDYEAARDAAGRSRGDDRAKAFIRQFEAERKLADGIARRHEQGYRHGSHQYVVDPQTADLIRLRPVRVTAEYLGIPRVKGGRGED